MGERYFITGVQIGILKSFLGLNREADAIRLLKKIEEQQFIGNSADLKDLGIK